MSYNPLPHSTTVGLPITATTSIPGPADHSDFDSTVHGQTHPPQAHSSKKRRPSKGKVSPEIRRSSSTPHMRNLALTSSSGELSPTGDKRRNKLGYHRTSVACGHCRRRKIRCLVAQDDPQGRCSNCIRLKKECNFYPVEQNPDQRTPTGSAKDAGSSAANASAASSPRQTLPSNAEKIEEYHASGIAPHGSTSRYGIPGDIDMDPTQIPHSGGVPLQHPPYTYPHPLETQWNAPGFLPSSSVAESSPSSSYWRPSPSTAPSTYGSDSNMSGGQTPTTISTTSNMSFGAPEGHWNQPPTRSMSYGNIEGLPHQYSGQGLPVQQQDYRGRVSPYAYPTSLDTNVATLHSTAMGASTSGPLSAPILASQQFGYPQTWNPYAVQSAGPEVPMQGRSMSAQWYAESPQLDKVQEEGAPPMHFNHPGMPHYYSGA